MENLQEIKNKAIVFTKIESEILKLLAKGKNDNQIADALDLEIEIIEKKRSAMQRKVQAKNLYGLVAYGIYTGMLKYDEIGIP